MSDAASLREEFPGWSVRAVRDYWIASRIEPLSALQEQLGCRRVLTATSRGELEDYIASARIREEIIAIAVIVAVYARERGIEAVEEAGDAC